MSLSRNQAAGLRFLFVSILMIAMYDYVLLRVINCFKKKKVDVLVKHSRSDNQSNQTTFNLNENFLHDPEINLNDINCENPTTITTTSPAPPAPPAPAPSPSLSPSPPSPSSPQHKKCLT
uniref:Uncharacterized protein n=1 Tax=Glossina brevipalpis TaxID=37001 RepID=A0A1A9X5F9_9MUSC